MLLKSFLQLLIPMFMLIIKAKRIKKKSVSRYTMKWRALGEKKVLKVGKKNLSSSGC